MEMEQEKLKALVEQARQGDPAAQESLLAAVQNRVYYHCKKMLKHEQDAQDAAQDVLIAVLTGLDKLREPAAFWGWVNGITANRCRHLLSAPHKEWQIPEDEEGNSMLESVESLDQTLVPEAVLDDAETQRMILDLVDALPPEQRMSVLFYYYDEMSVKQIAQAMEVSEGTVKSRLNYARKSIRSGVEEYERKGVKLYSLSPLVLLVLFLRQEAESQLLSPQAAAALSGKVLAGAATAKTAAGTAAAESGAAGGAASAGSAAGAAAKVAAAVKAGLSAKAIAGIVAGALLLGGGGPGDLLHSEPGLCIRQPTGKGAGACGPLYVRHQYSPGQHRRLLMGLGQSESGGTPGDYADTRQDQRRRTVSGGGDSGNGGPFLVAVGRHPALLDR